MRERPILAQYRGPVGEDLSELIAQADALRHSLGYTWAELSVLCGEDSQTLDRRGLVCLIGSLGSLQRGQHHG